jgi:hypothetical protein
LKGFLCLKTPYYFPCFPLYEKEKTAQNKEKTADAKKGNFAVYAESLKRRGDYENKEKRKGRDEKKPCAIYYDACRLDGAYPAFVDALFAEYSPRPLYRG